MAKQKDWKYLYFTSILKEIFLVSDSKLTFIFSQHEEIDAIVAFEKLATMIIAFYL